MQSNFERLLTSTLRGRPVRSLVTEVKSVSDWHQLNYLRIRTKFILDAILKDDEHSNHNDIRGLQMQVNADTEVLLATHMEFSKEEVEITDPRYTRIMTVIHTSRRAPADFEWTEDDLFTAVNLAFAQSMLLKPAEVEYFLSVSTRIFAHMHSLLLPAEALTSSSIFKNSIYRERAQGLLLSFLLMVESKYK